MGSLVMKKQKNDEIGDAKDVEQSKKTKTRSVWSKIKALLNRIRQLCEDWVYLFLLGAIMAILSLIMDFVTDNASKFLQWAYDQADQIDVGIWRILATYCVWTFYTVIVVFIAALLTRLIAPQAIGSGIPEIKTIFRGVILKEYLTIRTMIAKYVGITLTIAAGLPLGKEGPLVHMSAVVASQLSRLVHSFQGIYENESRSTEMLAAGCAVGVACTFSAPIGGVLFSIEVTSVFFAVRNYWRGFFAAACAATITRVVTTLLKDPDLDLNAQFQTRFPIGQAFTLQELPIFAAIGFVLGIVGAAIILVHRTIVLFLRRNNIAKLLFQRYWFVYPIVFSIFFGTLTYPEGLGQFMSGRKKLSSTVPDLFSNCTWSNTTFGQTCSEGFTNSWTGLSHDNSIFISLVAFQFMFFFLSITSTTLPLPAGMFIAAFVIGAAFGRTIGEIVAICLDGVIESGGKMQPLYPGVYAVVGAAALSGAFTHTVSVAVIVFEVTGQMTTGLPVMIAVIISVAVCSYLQPSIYDSVIRMKHLPYLPDIRHTQSIFHTVTVDRIMVAPVECIPKNCTYRHIRRAMENKPKLRAFPIVDSTESMVLLGSVNKYTLFKLLDEQMNGARREEEARKRMRAALFQATSMGIMGAMAKKEEQERKENEQSARSNGVPISREVSIDQAVADKKENEEERQHEGQVRQMTSELDGRAMADSATSVVPTNNDAKVRGFFRSLNRHHDGVQRESEEEDKMRFNPLASWEDPLLDETIDFDKIVIDSTPFQIVSHSSIFKMHSLFSLLGLNRAYVTEHGKLVGVVALKEIRDAIEKGQSGQLQQNVKEADHEEAEESEQDEPAHDVYDDDATDYEDNLQGRLEVVPRLEEATTLVADDHLQLQLVEKSMSRRASSVSEFSRMGSERARWRMDEMTVRRRRKPSSVKKRESERETTTTDDEGEQSQGKGERM